IENKRVTLVKWGTEGTVRIGGFTPPPQLTVIKMLVPQSDPGLFNLQIDGTILAINVGNGGSTGPLVVSGGVHTVSETASAGTNPFNYTVIIGGDCAPDGRISLVTGDNKTCTITNTRIEETECPSIRPYCCQRDPDTRRCIVCVRSM